MLVAPSEQRPQHRPKVTAGLRQQIFVARRSFDVAATLEQAGFDQDLQAPRQDIGCDSQALLELIETGQAVRRIAQNEDAPPFPDALEAAGDRALHVAEALVPHGFGSRSLACCNPYGEQTFMMQAFSAKGLQVGSR